MTVLITGGASPLAADLARLLAPHHSLFVLANQTSRLTCAHRAAGRWAPEELSRALDGVQAVVHLAGWELPADAGMEALDLGGRAVYNLAMAAIAAKVERFAYVSSMELLADYDSDYLLSPVFETRPSTQPWQLGLHLGEQVVREAAREGELPAATVRLGRLVLEEEVAGRPFDPLWVDRRDAAAFIAGLLLWRRPPGRGGWFDPTFHVCADRPDAASPPPSWGRRRRYRPQHAFAACPPREVPA